METFVWGGARNSDLWHNLCRAKNDSKLSWYCWLPDCVAPLHPVVNPAVCARARILKRIVKLLHYSSRHCLVGPSRNYSLYLLLLQGHASRIDWTSSIQHVPSVLSSWCRLRTCLHVGSLESSWSYSYRLKQTDDGNDAELTQHWVSLWMACLADILSLQFWLSVTLHLHAQLARSLLFKS